MKQLSIIAAILIGMLTLAACGGGGSGSGGAATAISGIASKGIIRNGSIKVYALNSDGSKGTLLRETVTDSSGSYRADLGTYQGAVLVEASGSYTDEATGTIKTVPADVPLRAAIDNVTGEATTAVTPLTELATQISEDPLTHKIRVPNIAASNAQISSLFKVNILTTMPIDPLVANPTASQEQKEHAVILAAFANLMESKSKDLHAVIAEFKESIGSDNSIAIPVAAQFQVALANFAGSSFNRTGITDISSTNLINIGGSIRPLTISVVGSTALISGIEIVVMLPPGVTVKADYGIVTTALQGSGGALSNSITSGHYTSPTASMRGKVTLAVVSTTAFAAGEFATLQCDVAPDATPKSADFIMTVLDAIDGQNIPLTGVSLNAQLQ